jgi:hypothetical protein
MGRHVSGGNFAFVKSAAFAAEIGSEKGRYQFAARRISCMGVCSFVLTLGFLSLLGSPAQGALIAFDEQPTGTIMSDQYLASLGVRISADNYRPTGPDKAIIFNSNRMNTPDLDLEFDWSAGNLKGTNLSRFLIVAENLRDVSPANGLVDDPDDEANGGTLIFKFDRPISSIGFDLIDVELVPAIDNVEFIRQGVSLASISFDKFQTPGSPFYDPTVVYADRSANRIKPLTTAMLGIQPFDTVKFNVPECAAIDNVVFLLPEPATAILSAFALVPIVVRPRQRH